MKRLLKAILRPVWNRTRSARRRLKRELTEALRASVDSSLAQAGITPQVGTTLEEIRVVLDQLVAEVYRLQMRVDEIGRDIEITQNLNEQNVLN